MPEERFTFNEIMSLFDAATRVYEMGKNIPLIPGKFGQIEKLIPISPEVREFRRLHKDDLDALGILLYNVIGLQIGPELPPSFRAGDNQLKISALKEDHLWVFDPISITSGRKLFSDALREVKDRESAAWCIPTELHPTMGKIVLGHGMWSHGAPRSIWYGVFTSVAKEKFNLDKMDPVLSFQQRYISGPEPRRFPQVTGMLKDVPEDNTSEIYIKHGQASAMLCDYIGLDLQHIGLVPRSVRAH